LAAAAANDALMLGPLGLVLSLLLALLAGAVWVGPALMAIGVIALEAFRDMRVDRFLAGDIWSSSVSVELITLPLFILMGRSCITRACRRTCSAGFRRGHGSSRGGSRM